MANPKKNKTRKNRAETLESIESIAMDPNRMPMTTGLFLKKLIDTRADKSRYYLTLIHECNAIETEMTFPQMLEKIAKDHGTLFGYHW